MGRHKFTYVFLSLLYVSHISCEISFEKKNKLVNGFIDFYNSLPNQIYTCNEGYLQNAQQSTEQNSYEIEVALKVSDLHHLESSKNIRCTGKVVDLEEVGVSILNHHCEEIPGTTIGSQEKEVEEIVVTETSNDAVETTFVREPIQLDNEVQTNTAVTSGEQFVAVPREEQKLHCIGCSSHVNPQAPGVSDLAAIGVRQLNSLEPNVQHTLNTVVDVERQVQVVNGIRYILTLVIDYNSCLTPETETCLDSKTCKITFLEKPWVQLPDGSKYRAILSNNCTEEWRFGDNGVVVPQTPTDSRENNNINGPQTDGSDVIKPLHNVDVQAQPPTEKTLTDDDIKVIQTQIIPYSQFNEQGSEPALTASSEPTETSDPGKEHVVKIGQESQFSPNAIPITNTNPITIENLSEDKKKAIDDMLNFFNFAGFDSARPSEDKTRTKRSFNTDLNIMNLVEKFQKVKKNVENAKYVYKLAQIVVDYLNEIDLGVKTRVLKDVLNAEEESENHQHFYYIQARVIIPCDKSECEEKDTIIKICNAVLDDTNKNVQIINVFCHDEPKAKPLGKVNSVSLDDPVLLKLITEAINKIESESSLQKALKLNKIIDANTQRVSGTLTKFSIILYLMNCEKTVPFILRSNCSIIEELGSQICDVTVHERHWLKEKKITYTCTERPVDTSFSSKRKTVVEKSVNDPAVLGMVNEALQYLDLQSNRNNKQIVVRVNSVATQLVAGFLTDIEFVVGYTTCANDVKNDTSKCKLLEDEPLRTCKAKVWDRTWIEDGRQVDVSCKDHFIEEDELSRRVKRDHNLVGGPSNKDVNHPMFKIMAEEALRKYLQSSVYNRHFKVVSVHQATVQIVAGTLTKLEFKISPTTCLIDKEGNPSSLDCKILDHNDVSTCNSVIWEKPWLDFKEINTTCQVDKDTESFKLQETLAPKERNPNEPEYLKLAEESMHKFFQDRSNVESHKVIAIEKVTVSGTKTMIEFKILPTEKVTSDIISCESEIWKQPSKDLNEIKVNCNIDSQPRTKRDVSYTARRLLSYGDQTNQDVNDPKFQCLANESFQKFLKSSEGHDYEHYGLISIEKVTVQIMSEIITRLKFSAFPTNCQLDTDENLSSSECKVIDAGNVIRCSSEIKERHSSKDIDVTCHVDDVHNRVNTGGLQEQELNLTSRTKRALLGGLEKQDPSDPKFRKLAEESMHKYLTNNGNNKVHQVIEITSVSTQVVPGSITKITFKISPADQTTGDVLSCHSDIWERPWKKSKEITVDCDIVNPSRTKRALPGSLVEQDPNSPEFRKLAEESMHKYLTNNGNTKVHQVMEVTSVTKQIVSRSKTVIKFKISPADQTTGDILSCTSNIWEQPWNNIKEITVDCGIANPSRTKRSQPGGLVEQDPNDPTFRKLAEESMHKYLTNNGNTKVHQVMEITSVTKQIVAGSKIKIKFTISPADQTTGDVLSCNSDIWEQPWNNFKEITVDCGIANSSRTKREALHAPKSSDRRRLMGDKKDQDPTKVEYKELAQASLEKYLKLHMNSNLHSVVEVKKVKTQAVSGTIYNIEYIAAFKSCADNISTCLGANSVFYCTTKIWDQPWLGKKSIDVLCKSNNKNTKTQSKQSLELKDIQETIFEGEHREKRQAAAEEYVDEDISFYYADRAIKQLNDQSNSNNLHKLVTIHGFQNSVHMDQPMVRMYIETSETYCLRHRDEHVLAECEELSGINHRLCLVRLWPSSDDELVIKQVSLVCDDDEKFESISGLSIQALLRASIKQLEKSPNSKYKLVHQGEPQVIPTLDSSLPITINFIVASTNCSKKIDLDLDPANNNNCFLDITRSSKACQSRIWLAPNTKTIRKILAKCGKSESRKRRSVSLTPSNSTADELIIQNLVQESLHKLEMASSNRYKQRVLQINSYSTKITSGKVTTIDFDVAYTSCLKFEWVEDVKSCEFIEHLPRRHCVSQVWERLWVHNGRNIEVTCEEDETPLEAHVEFESAETAMKLATEALKHIEAKYPHPRRQKVVRIFSLEKQVVAGIHYRMKIEVGSTQCSALSAETGCKLDKDVGNNKFCRVNVWLRPWTNHAPNFRVTCDYQEASTADLYHHVQAELLFRDFIATYRPEYIDKPNEMKRKFEIFKTNIRKIHELNIHEKGTATYGVTRFADLSYEEFTKKYLGLKPSLRDSNQVPMRQAEIPNLQIPDKFDWRTHGAVTEVKNQGSCGSCWAFSVTGNIEGQWKMQSGQLVSLSEQELVDCDKLDQGCNGGLPDNAYRAIEQLGGLELENDYPYEGEDDKCSYNSTMTRVKITGAVNITSNETGMAKWLVHNGPISIGINANAMQFYMGGVSHPWKMLCNPTNLDHGVLIVGYGIKDYPLFHKRLPYWTIKNSWGPEWGEQGYYRVYRGDGTCGVNQMASSAVI